MVHSRKLSQPRGRPVDLGKRGAILDAAHRLFMAAGYGATTMEDIAHAAGVAKLTAYKHFGSKSALFAAVVERKCQSMLGEATFGFPAGARAKERLIAVGRKFVELVLSADAVAVHNVIVQERERAPELGLLFFNSAVQNASRRVAALLLELDRRGEIVVPDPDISARDILQLWRSEPAMRLELGLPSFSAAELDAHVERVTDLMLKAWR